MTPHVYPCCEHCGHFETDEKPGHKWPCRVQNCDNTPGGQALMDYTDQWYDSLREAAALIPPSVLSKLDTTHSRGNPGYWLCVAHDEGQTCCVDILLEAYRKASAE